MASSFRDFLYDIIAQERRVFVFKFKQHIYDVYYDRGRIYTDLLFTRNPSSYVDEHRVVTKTRGSAVVRFYVFLASSRRQRRFFLSGSRKQIAAADFKVVENIK